MQNELQTALDLPTGDASDLGSIVLIAATFGFYLFFITVFACNNACGERIRSKAMKNRLKHLDQVLKSEIFYEWSQRYRKNHPTLQDIDLEDQICVICLEPIENRDPIRALICGHIYHCKCFDHWFEGFHDFCPLCRHLALPTDEELDSENQNA